MAGIDYQGYAPDLGYSGPGRGTRLFNLIGGVVSLGLIAGLGYWSYELLMRDVTGIPVVQAIDGPMRVLPDDPEGERAAHQGLAVNRIAAEGEAAPPAERIVLAPRSADLADEDLAQAALRLQPEATAAPVPATAVEEAVLEATTGVMETEAGLEDGTLEIIPASVPGVSRSPRPHPRPFRAAPVAASSTVSEPAAPATLRASSAPERDPATIPTGTWLVQFDALDTPDDARSHWAALEAKFGALMAGKARVIEEGSSGADTFYRLRAEGFVDLADARRFCAALVAEDADCIPVMAK
jgi:hypothetical protein